MKNLNSLNENLHKNGENQDKIYFREKEKRFVINLKIYRSFNVEINRL